MGLIVQTWWYILIKGPIVFKVFIISVLMIILGSVHVLVLSPIIFNYILIPKIEKKVGRKLCYPSYFNYFGSGYFIGKQAVVARYLVNRYWAFKFKKGVGPAPYTNAILFNNISYPIKMISKAEIFFSFMLYASIYITLLGVAMLFIVSAFMPSPVSK